MAKMSRKSKIITLTLVVMLGLGAYFLSVTREKQGSSSEGSYFLWPKDQIRTEVAGAHAQNDPLHPTEIYFGAAQFHDLKSMAKDLAIQIYPEDKVDAFPPPEMGLGSQLTIIRATPVIVTDAKKTNTYRTWSKNITELLAEQHIELLGKDSVDPAGATLIQTNLKVKITRVAEIEITQKEPIDFKTVKHNDHNMERGQQIVEQKGAPGEKEVIYLVKRVDGDEVSRKVKETNVLTDPTTEILTVGTGPKLVHSGPFVDLLNAAAKQYDVNATSLQCLMLRESGGTPETGYPDAYYKGLFQYEDGYWADASSRSGFGGASIYDAKAQIFTTAMEIANGQSRRWPPYAHCANL